MAKPTVLPRWANVGGSVVTPSSGKMDIGWLGGEKPPAQYLNWLGLNTYTWLAWVDTLINSSDQWTKGVVADANLHVQVSGTGQFKHGDRTLVLGPQDFVIDGGVALLSTAGYMSISASAARVAYAAIHLPTGKRIKSVTVYMNPQSTASMRPYLSKRAIATGLETDVWTGSLDASGAITSQTSGAIIQSITATDTWYVKFQLSSTNHRIYGAIVVFDEN